MPFPSLSDLLPRSLSAAIVLWALANYFVIGPNIASRVVRADYLPVCEANFKDVARRAGDERLNSIPLPSLDAGRDYALETAKRMLDSPAMLQLRQMGGGLGEAFGLDIDGAARQALARAEEARRRAQEAYRQSVKRIREETATNLASAGTLCGCIADQAIADTRRDWAIFSGTLTLFRPTPIANFAERMAQLERSGGCSAAKTGA
jgi:hypothetical protein